MLHEEGRLQTEHEFLYRDLTILDDKSSALLTFNSIILAAITVFLTTSGAGATRFVFLVAFLIMGFSAYLCLRVVWLQWSELQSLTDRQRSWINLHQVRDQRTRWYRKAWLLAQVALGVLVLGAILDAFV